MPLSLIAAVSENGVIGKGGKLPWDLPADLQRFRELTKDHPVIMGRKTYESIGKPLPHRSNIVITRQEVNIPGCTVVHSFKEAIQASEASEANEAFIIGGAEIYRAALPFAHRIYLTRVHVNVEGDAFFPEVDFSQWREVSRERHEADAEHAYPFTFLVYEREKRFGKP
jgi:dihydrofolate reductase